MRSIKNSNFLMALIISLVLILGFGFCIRLYAVYLDQNIYHYHSANINTNYNPIYNNEIDSKIKKLIKHDKKYNNSLILTSSARAYKNFKFIHIGILENNQRKDLSYIYDDKSNTYKLDEFFINNTALNLFKKRIDTNYRHFYFNKDGLVLIYDYGEVSLPYTEINNLLKEKYRKKKVVLPEVRDIESFRDKKLVCFTFDDGPNEATTNILLDNLDKYNARVTFFVLGMKVNSNKDVLKRAYLMGNDIGSHTYGHKDLTYLKDKKVLWEINNTNEKIHKVIGTYPKYMRPPYGSINNKTMKLYDMNTILWNVDSLDWKLKNREKTKKEIIKHAKDGNIILMHDIYEESVYGALMAMEELKKQGYEFVTISEMSYLKDIELDKNKVHFGF